MTGRDGNDAAASTLASAALFGTVAMAVAGSYRAKDSAEDLGTSFFDSDHEALERFVQSVPKVELHIHLDGSFDPEELWRHLEAHPELLKCLPVEKQLPWSNEHDPPLRIRGMIEECQSALNFRHLCTCRKRWRYTRRQRRYSLTRSRPTLEDMLTCFEFFLPLVQDNFALLEHLAYDFVKRQYEQNVIYTEVRYSPHLFVSQQSSSSSASSSAKLAVESVTRGLRRGCQQYGVTVNQILCAIDFLPNESAEIAELAHQHRNDFPCAVVGVDVAAGENHFDKTHPFHKGHFDMCQTAKDLDLNITIHAGETPDAAHHVHLAIDQYGAKRIGHGYRIVGTPEIMKIVEDRNIHIEVCPTSSVETGGWKKTVWSEHPALTFHQFGISQSLSSDDPSVFNTSLTWQYRIAIKKMGFTKEQVLQMTKNGIQAAFVSDQEKQELLDHLEKYSVEELRPAFTDRVHYETLD